MKTILVPIDFSPVSKVVLAQAIALARDCRGKIVLAHVVTLPAPFIDYGMMNFDASDLITASQASAKKLLARWRERAERSQVPLKTVECVGLAAVEIVRLARKLRVDYIVLGSHGHTAFYDLLVGSTAAGVLKHAPCPVVVVPARKISAARRR